MATTENKLHNETTKVDPQFDLEAALQGGTNLTRQISVRFLLPPQTRLPSSLFHD